MNGYAQCNNCRNAYTLICVSAIKYVSTSGFCCHAHEPNMIIYPQYTTSTKPPQESKQ